MAATQAEFLVHPAAGRKQGTDDVEFSLVTFQSNSCCSMEISTICAKESKETLLAKCIKVSIYANSQGLRTRGLS